MTQKPKNVTYGFKSLLILLMDISALMFFASLIIVITRFFAEYLAELPVIFQIGYGFGSLVMLIKVMTINWSGMNR